MVQTQARFNLAFQKLSDIAYGDENSSAQIVALRTLMEMDLKLLSAEMDAGLYKRDPIKTETEVRNRPLDPEIKARIITAMRNYGLVLPQKNCIKKRPPRRETRKPVSATGGIVESSLYPPIRSLRGDA